MLSRCVHGDQNACLFNGKLALMRKKGMDDKDAEQICEAIFMLIPEVQRLKELFLCWSLLDSDERAELDSQIHKWVSPERAQLYKPLREALCRWELVQDTQGAPGCEPGMVSFSCDPQLEEEIVNVIYTLETLLDKLRTSTDRLKKRPENGIASGYPMAGEVPPITSKQETARIEQPLGLMKGRVKERLPRSVQSCCFPLQRQNSMEDISGYKTD
ncbi:hypothetical protein C0J52_22468 [Blattella germanica]|nr:hypothetical protein C0J52_22468 [Blattella germanica]